MSLALRLQSSLNLLGIFGSFSRIGQPLFGRLNSIVSIILVAWKYMEVKMKSMLITGRFIILTCRNTIAFVNFLHGQSNLLGHIKDSMTIFGGQSIETLEMLVWDKDNMAGVFAYKERVDKASYKFIFVDDIARLHKCVWTFSTLDTKANRAYIIVRSIIFYHLSSIQELECQKVWSSYLPYGNTAKNITPFEGLYCRIISWLGLRDSNPRMPGPKPGALPLGQAPIYENVANSVSRSLTG